MPESRYITTEELERHCKARHEPINNSLTALFNKLDKIIYLIIACLLTIIGGLIVQLSIKQTEPLPPIELRIDGMKVIENNSKP